jgi:hypothetical protein
MSAFMVFFVTNAGEHAHAVLALVGLFTRMSPEMHHQISLLGEGPAAIKVRTLEKF